jgi:imidazolonepropionase-like amidohydrolase
LESRSVKSIVHLVVVALAPVALAFPQDTPQAFVGARIIPIAGSEITDGVLVVHQGKITAVGPASSAAILAGAERHEVRGLVLMPGLVDTHSHIGSVEGADSTAPIQPDVRVLDSINVRNTRIQKAQAGGITTANVMPGSGHLLSGQTLYLKLRDGNIIDDLLIRDAQGNVAGGMKMANGTNSRGAAPFSGTRAKSAALVREQYVIVHPTMARAAGETENLSMETASKLRKAGILTALQSGFESYVPKTRVLLYEAGIAAANGLSFDEALASITIDAARLLEVDKRVGSLESGKDGDLALFDGDPFEYPSHCVGVVIQGEVVSQEPR